MSTRRQLLAAALTPPPAVSVWNESNIPWQPDDPPGCRYAVLTGRRDDPAGVFTYAFALPGKVWAPAHVHSQDAHVVVVRGSLRVGIGRRTDRAHTRLVRAGEFFLIRANEPHFEGSDEECVIIGTARGGWKTTLLE